MDQGCSYIIHQNNYSDYITNLLKFTSNFETALYYPNYLVCVTKTFGQISSHYGFSDRNNPNGVYLFPEESQFLFVKDKIYIKNFSILPPEVSKSILLFLGF